MKTSSKRIVSIILAIALLMGLMPVGTVTVFAETATSGYCGSNLLWEYDTSTYTLTISNQGTSSSSMGNYSYGSSPWFSFKDSIKTVIADNKVSSVGKFAFMDCSSLETVNMPGVTDVGDYAFDSCASLKSVILSSNASWSNAKIGESAFAFCSSLTKIVIPFQRATIGKNAFEWCENLTTIGIDNYANIGDYAFAHCPISSIYMIRNENPFAGTVSKNAFSGVNADVYYFYGYAPYQNNGFGGQLTYKKVTSGLIGYNAFWNYDQTNELLTISGEGELFKYTGGSDLPWMYLNNGSYQSSIKTIVVEDGITVIPQYAFEYMGNVESVTLPNTLLKLYPNAFNDCKSLTELVIPSSVEYVDGQWYWYRCPNLNDVYYVGTEQEWNNVYTCKEPNSYCITPYFLTYHAATQSCTTVGYPAHYEFDGTTNHTFYDLNKIAIATPEPSKLDHSFNDVWNTNATRHWHTCTLCGTAVSDDANHSYDNPCDETCNVCGYTRIVNHEFNSKWSQDSTNHWHECTICGNAVKDVGNHIYSNACDTTCNTCGYERSVTHSFATTWTSDSMNHWHKCTVCGKADVQLYHVYDNSCDATCNVCGYVRQIEHNYSVYYYADDDSHWRLCSVCGEKSDYEPHAWDDGIVTKSPSCIKTGVRTYTCSVCGKKSTETIETTGHTIVRDEAVPVSCTIDGMTAGSHCSVCGEIFEPQEPIPSSGHNFSRWGYNSLCHWLECSICGEKDDYLYPHIYDHNYDEDCNTCGYVRTVNPVNSPIKSIQAGKITLIENISGYRDDMNNCFVYTIPETLDITVTLNNGTVLTAEENHGFIIDSEYYFPRYNPDTSGWVAGNTYTVNAELCGKIFSFDVEIIANDYTGLNIEQTDDFYLIFEKRDGTEERHRVISFDPRLGDQGLIGGILKTDKYEFPLVKFHYSAPDNGYSEYEKNVFLEIGNMTSNTVNNFYWLKAQSLKSDYIMATTTYRWYSKYSNNQIFRGYNKNDYDLDVVITIAANALLKWSAQRYEVVDDVNYGYVSIDDIMYALRYMFGLTKVDLTEYSLYDYNNPNQFKFVCIDGGYGPNIETLTFENGQWDLTFKELEVNYPYDYIHFVLDDTFTVQSIEFVNDTDCAADTEILVENQKSLVGNEITVSVDISNNVGIAYLKLNLEYDMNALELISTSNTNLLHGSYTESQNINEVPYVLQWMGADDSNGNGTIVDLTFRVKDNALPGNYPVSSRVAEAYNSNFEYVDIFIKSGTIAVYDYLVGDFNGDGVINGKDGILCSQALAGWNIEYSLAAADVNGDGEFNGKDGILLSQYLAGWNVTLG
ncbi:MAG: leucine-rich repeat protein [Clostridia bacterium]|nr:leucine-rich repeat protein [Clostridia bacterium]